MVLLLFCIDYHIRIPRLRLTDLYTKTLLLQIISAFSECPLLQVYFEDFNPLRWWQHLMNTLLYIGYKNKSYIKKQEKKNESTLLYQLDYLCKVSHILLLLIQFKVHAQFTYKFFFVFHQSKGKTQ